jgi:hypothetical protein
VRGLAGGSFYFCISSPSWLNPTNLRLMEAYICANEALAANPTHRLAATLLNHALYTIHPKKRLLDNANRLFRESQVGSISSGEAFELLTQAMKWRPTVEILRARALYCAIGR